jgi:ankyrin repeat protein
MADEKLDVMKLIKFGSPKKFIPNSTICTEGTLGREMYLILKGSVDVSISGINLANIKAGSFFGEMSLLTDAPRSATCKAHGEAYLLILDQHNFGRVIREEPILAFKIMQVMAERISKLNSDIKSASKQIAKTTKSHTLTDNMQHNDVLEVIFSELSLFQALSGKNEEFALDMITRTEDEQLINSADAYGRTFLMISAIYGHINCVEKLLEKEVDIEKYDISGNTVLHHAAQSGNKMIAKRILDAGGQINARNTNDQTPLILAASSGDYEIVNLLLSKGADHYKRDITGNMAISYTIINGYDSLFSFMIDKYDDIDDTDKFGNTLLHHALKNSREEMGKKLIEKGARGDKQDKNGKSPLDIATDISAASIVQLLRKK